MPSKNARAHQDSTKTPVNHANRVTSASTLPNLDRTPPILAKLVLVDGAATKVVLFRATSALLVNDTQTQQQHVKLVKVASTNHQTPQSTPTVQSVRQENITPTKVRQDLLRNIKLVNFV